MDITQNEHVRSSVFVSDGIVIVDLFESLYYLLLFPAFKKKDSGRLSKVYSKDEILYFSTFSLWKVFLSCHSFCNIKNETISVKQ